MADLSGDNVEPLGAVEDRRFSEIDVENFDERIAQIAPSLSYHVKNVLTDDGTLIPIDLSFTSMDSFEPAEVVRRIPELSTLLDARNRLKELMTYMDGKAAAEDLIHELLKNSKWSDDEPAPSAPADATALPGDAAPHQDEK